MTIYTDYNFHIDYYGIELKTGIPYLVCENRNTIKGTKYYSFNPDISKGIPGNMDPSVRRYHGWRGTTDNVSRYALGVRKIEKITRFGNGNCRLVLSEDMYPSWD